MSDAGDLGPRAAAGGSPPGEGPEPPERPPSPAGWPSWTPQNPPRGWPSWSPPTWNPEDLISPSSAGAGAAPAQPPQPAPPAPGAPPSPVAAEPESAGEDVALEESFLTIWLEPRATIRRIVLRNPKYLVLPLAAAGGITQVLSSVARRGEANPSLGGILLTALIAGPIFGIVALYLTAWLTRLTGGWWLHGRAGSGELRTALGWASLAHVLALPLWLLATALFGAALFRETTFDLVSRSWLYALFLLAGIGLQLWGLVIASAGVAEVQGYGSAWKGFWNLVLAALLLLLSAILLGLLFALVAGLLGLLAR